MRSLLISLAAVAALLVVSTDGSAADYEMVGYTTTTHDGNDMFWGYTAACQADYGATARMCNSVEIIETVNLPTLTSGTIGWAQPVLVPNTGVSDRTLDASLVAGASTTPAHDRLNCQSWRFNGAAVTGLTYRAISSAGAFQTGDCNVFIPAACCDAVPAPAFAAVPSMLWFGRGLLAALIVSAAAGVVFFRARPVLGSGERGVSRRG